jgi:hypothetical protein
MSGFTNSPVTSATYVIEPQLPTPMLSMAPLGDDTNQKLTITDATPRATIYYTTNGTMPTTLSAVYTQPVAFNRSGTFTVEAIAIASGFSPSAVATGVYTIRPFVAKPTFSPPAGGYTTPQMVIIHDVSTLAVFYYTTDGSMPTTLSTLYSGPITVSSNQTINAISVMSGFTNSPVTSATYVIEPQLPTPMLSMAPLGDDTNQKLTITDANGGATVYYTTNGTIPTTSSAVYTQPVAFNRSGTFTVNAIAVASGYLNSTVATAVYTIHPFVAKPTFSPPAGGYTTTQTVTIHDVSITAIFYYTTDGSMPTTASTLYSGPITISSNQTINAIAVMTGFTNSPVTSAAYTIAPP